MLVFELLCGCLLLIINMFGETYMELFYSMTQESWQKKGLITD